MHHLWLATRNAHKTREFGELLGHDFDLEDITEHPEIDEVAEDGATFLENAELKALAVSRQLPGLVLADDSGLEADSLGGAPGIFSARYAGAGANDELNRRKLLEALARLPEEASRVASFRCVLVLAQAGETIATFEGVVEGTIAREDRGEGGFGYDALFLSHGFKRTFAQLSAAEKNAVSHRARAALKLREFLLNTARRGDGR